MVSLLLCISLVLIGIKVPKYFFRTNDPFVITYYRKRYGADSFFPCALLLANKISTSIDFSHNKFKSIY